MIARCRRRAAYAFALLLLCFAPAGCVKVKPDVYQIALERYYRGLLGGATEQKLTDAITGLTADLDKRPSDANLLLLRTNARLQLLRLAVETKRTFDADRRIAFFEDLRLLRSLLSQPGDRPLWLNARVQTLFGDALLLRTQAVKEKAGAAAVRDHIERMQLFRLAADTYLRAAGLVNQAMGVVKAGKDLESNLPALGQELENARDGYTNALTGMAQSEIFLRLAAQARQHLLDANAVSMGGAFPPPSAPAPPAASLFAYGHDLISDQAAALESLTPNDFPARVQFAETALREGLAAELLSGSDRAASERDLTSMAGRLRGYYAGMTLVRVEPVINGSGTVATESISFALQPDPLYASAKISAEVPALTLQAGAEKIDIRLAQQDSSEVKSFAVPPGGLRLTIQSAAGVNTVTSGGASGTYFLGRGTPLFAKGAVVKVISPAENAIVQTVVP